MSVKITTLMENSAVHEYLACEHGLSVLIEGEGFRILYDTGSSPKFLQNARSMGVELNDLDALILSHGHYDHTGGVSAFLAETTGLKKIYIGKNFFDDRYARRKDGLLDISPQISRRAMAASGVAIETVESGCKELFPGVWIVSGFRATQSMEQPPAHMLRGSMEGPAQDCFEDEVAVVISSEKELCLVSGCSHNGIISMCDKTEEYFGREVTTFIGGTHLMEADDRRIEETCRCLKKKGMRRLGACHCNGEKANAFFAVNFPGFFKNNTGTAVSID